MVIATSCIAAADVRPIPTAGRSAVAARNGMVAASQPLASQAGLRILQQGGNAVDAAIATAATLALVAPMMTGPGGDMFALVYMAETGELAGLNGSGFSPAAANVDFFKRRNLEHIPAKGPFSVTVPGAVDGWITLLERFGTMSLDQVLGPAIEYAEQGFPVSEIFAENWASNSSSYKDDPEFVKAYYTDGKPPKHGDVFVNEPLAWTYRQIARGGRDAFYKGEIARRIVERLNGLGWPMTEADLAYQHSDWVEPISTTYKGHRIYELPPNGQGMAALEMLNILEGFDLQAAGHNTAGYLHLFVEAKRLAFADLGAWLADPARARLPVQTLISKDYARRQRERIDPARAAESVDSGVKGPVHWLDGSGDTVYFSVVDKDRNAVSFINSLFQGFGSGVVVPDTGLLLQDRGALFSLDPEHPNRIEGRKRPYHTIIPAMAFKDGKPWLSFGVMGGDLQPQGHVQVLLNMIEFGMNVQEAGEAPRASHSNSGGVGLEKGISPQVAAELIRKGHSVKTSGPMGGYQAIHIDWERGVLFGGTDPRKDGTVAAW
ncbi:MAG: gamma-glutamyltransferase [Bryobacterales bacterium]|nr:gamma-glutamyltransferase [Bryobacterales bacterium]